MRLFVSLLCFFALAFLFMDVGEAPNNMMEMGVPMLPLLCLIQPVDNKGCPKGRGGISRSWVTECSNVVQIFFDSDRTIVGLMMNADPGAGRFVPLNFEKKTGGFEQAKTKVKQGTNVTQTMSIIEPVLNPVTHRLLEDLNDCCCYHAIIKDNNGRLLYAGISYFKDTDTWQSEDMVTGDGSANTGVDPTADASEYAETLVADTVWYAPFVAFDESAIPV